MVYLDNAATTLIKPQCVYEALSDCMYNYMANAGRGSHSASMRAAETCFNLRESLAALFNISDSSRIIFTSNCTEALNLAINGIIKKSKNPHVVITGMEHNSVIRPIVGAGARYSVAKADNNGEVKAATIGSCITDDTCLVVATHASNVTGTINNIKAIGKTVRSLGIPFLVDAAQTAGILPIDVDDMCIDMLAFPGHKGLFGPTGTGGLYIGEGMDLIPLKFGGTGSYSESLEQPDFLPDRYESGTLNTLGIAGLNAGVQYILQNSRRGMYEHEAPLIRYFESKLKEIHGIRLLGGSNRVGVFAIDLIGRDSADTAQLLSDKYDIATRGGMHCSVLAHTTLGTVKYGILRASISSLTTKEDIDYFLKCIKTL